MGLSPLQSALARELHELLKPHGRRQASQTWERGTLRIRLMVEQGASVRDALVRFTVQVERTDTAHNPHNPPERMWFLLQESERRTAVVQQLALLSRIRIETKDEEVCAVAGILQEMTDDDPNVETWFVAGTNADAAAWGELLRPALERAVAR